MSKHPYFDDYLQYLRDGGAMMAQNYPRIADRLDGEGLDPDVELLLRGIAFISGEIARRREISLEETTQLAFDMLFPHYLSPIPAASIVEFNAKNKPSSSVIKRGTEIRSEEILGTECRFTTLFDVYYDGVQLNKVDWKQHGRRAHLTLKFSDLQHLDATRDSLRLYLHGDHIITRSLYHALQTGIRSVRLGKKDVSNLISISPCGFSEHEAMLQYPLGSFPGFRILQEYFAFPEKFLFIELKGARAALAKVGANLKEQALEFDLSVDAGELVVGDHHIRLHCTPVVNIFEHHADPIWRNHVGEYYLRPMGKHLHHEIYRVTQVIGRTYGRQDINYHLLSEIEDTSKPYAQLFRRKKNNEVLTYIAVDDGKPLSSNTEMLLVDLLATNGKLPLGLSVGDIHQLPIELQSFRCQDIVPICHPVSPPSEIELRRRLIAHMALTQRDLAQLSSLRDAMDLYNFSAHTDAASAQTHLLLMQSIDKIAIKQKHRSHRDAQLWGRNIRFTLNEDSFDTFGDLFLFSLVLNEYIALQTPLNQFSKVSFVSAQTLEEFSWPMRAGPHLLSEL